MTSKLTYEEFDQKSRELLDRLAGRLDEQNLRFANEFWDHGEWDLLMEAVLDGLIEAHVPISPDEYQLVELLATQFERPDRDIEFINNPERFLASLKVVEEQ
jgi:hypothetical protein